MAGHQLAEPYAQQAHQLPAFVQLLEQLAGVVEQHAVGSRVRQLVLPGEGTEIGIPKLYGDAGGQPLRLPQFEGELGHHLIKGTAQKADICSVGLESTLGGDGLPLGVGHNWPVVDAMGFFPQSLAGLTKLAL